MTDPFFELLLLLLHSSGRDFFRSDFRFSLNAPLAPTSFFYTFFLSNFSM